MSSVVEQLYTVQQVAALWGATPYLVRKAFRGRAGVLTLGDKAGKPTWRIPASLVLDVMIEKGYTAEQAEKALARAREAQ